MGVMMNLYAGKVLKIDLSKKTITAESLNRQFLKDYFGGWGLALRYFWDEVAPTVEPLSPNNAIVIMTGPLCGTLAPMTSRLCLVSKSPHTGTIMESNVGGAFGPELKFAGYDGIIITGRSDSLVYLLIEDEKVSLEDAVALKGKGIFQTDSLLKKAIGSSEAKTLAIGPAGENLVTYACIGSDAYRQMGRGGGGALFGSKNLKGIVCRGSGGVQAADMKAFMERVSHYKETNLFTNDNLWANTDGTPLLVGITNEMGIHPTRNFTLGVNERRSSLDSKAIQKAKLGDRACASCPLACGNFTRINRAEVEGPEYETLCLTGSNCEVNDLEQVIRLNRLCDDFGLDTISYGNIIALAMEMTESGYHNFGLHFGKPKGYLKVVSEIATLSTERGKDLALGAKKLAEKYNAKGLSTEVKGMEFPAYEPRGNYGMGLAYATSERGACHLRAFTIFEKDPFDMQALVRCVIQQQDSNAIKWSMCFCDFWGTVDRSIMADLLSAGLGEEVRAEDLGKAGERIWNLARLFNLRAGFTAADDTLPQKLMTQTLQNGPHKGRVFTAEDFAAMKRNYYLLRGWDEGGQPTRGKLEELDLGQL